MQTAGLEPSVEVGSGSRELRDDPGFLAYLEENGLADFLDETLPAEDLLKIDPLVPREVPEATIDTYAECLRLTWKRENEGLNGDEETRWNELALIFEPKIAESDVRELERRSEAGEKMSRSEQIAWDAALRRAIPRNREQRHAWRGLSIADVLSFQPDGTPRTRPRAARPGSQRKRVSGSSRDGPRRETDDEPLEPLPARVPADRLADLIRRDLDGGETTITNLAARAGVPRRRLRSILRGEQARVDFSTADAIVTALAGGPSVWLDDLADLYGRTV